MGLKFFVNMFWRAKGFGCSGSRLNLGRVQKKNGGKCDLFRTRGEGVGGAAVGGHTP